MDIPDRISDMDSVPDALSLASLPREDVAAVGAAIISDAASRYFVTRARCGESARKMVEALEAFRVQAEMAELTIMASL